jgi:hypothetical protein
MFINAVIPDEVEQRLEISLGLPAEYVLDQSPAEAGRSPKLYAA